MSTKKATQKKDNTKKTQESNIFALTNSKMPIAFMHGGSKPTPRKSSDKSDEKEVRRQIFGRRGTIAVPAYSTTGLPTDYGAG